MILGLIQLTGKADFADRKVLFTRYELLKLLNWTDDTRNYNRLEQSLNAGLESRSTTTNPGGRRRSRAG